MNPGTKQDSACTDTPDTSMKANFEGSNPSEIDESRSDPSTLKCKLFNKVLKNMKTFRNHKACKCLEGKSAVNRHLKSKHVRELQPHEITTNLAATAATCKNYVFPSFQSMNLQPCIACPTFHLLLSSDLTLLPDKPTFGKVILDGFILEQGTNVHKFAKIYTNTDGTLLMPQSLNMVNSDNPNPIPKPNIDGTVTINFLNTLSSPVPLKKGQTVGRGQILYIKN